MTGKEYAQKLRVIANLYEENPNLKVVPILPNNLPLDIWYLSSEIEEFRRMVVKIGGKKKVSPGGSFIGIEKELYPGISIFINVMRGSICTRKVIGVEKVTLSVETTPAQYEEEEVEREIVEWECPESFWEKNNDTK